MTRVNLVPVEELYDQHLLAEYRELPMIPASLKRSLAAKKGFDVGKIPQTYVLGSGHIRFFYNKGLFLTNRYRLLVNEMMRRGMSPNPDRLFPCEVFPDPLFNDWVPTEEEIAISRNRINERVAQKPKWYRKTRVAE